VRVEKNFMGISSGAGTKDQDFLLIQCDNVNYDIRAFAPADLEELWRLDQACFPPGIAYTRAELLSYMRRRNAFTLVAERALQAGDGGEGREGKGLAGFIVAESGRLHTGHVITIDVRAEDRRSGLGARLMQAAEDRLRQLGCRGIVLEAAVDNQAALAFYKRQGYFLVKTIPRYYTTGVDAFVLKKELLAPVSAS